jgi:rare lipoprotein A
VSVALRMFALSVSLFALSACGTAPTRTASPPQPAKTPASSSADVADAPKRSPYAPAEEDPGKRGDYVAGGLYAPHIQDSAPDEVVDVDAIPEPEVKVEPRSRVGNRSYAVLGKRYQIRDSAEGYVEEGMASFYGKKFHGRLTSNQEVYDMYTFSAAHKSLPLPSYVRVTNLANGKSVVVRVNDRGPFHAGRIIDLSYAAATKLGFIKQGTARVEVRALTAGGDRAARRGKRTADTRPPSPSPPPPPAAGRAATPDGGRPFGVGR